MLYSCPRAAVFGWKFFFLQRGHDRKSLQPLLHCINWHKSEAMPVSQSCSPNLLSFSFKLFSKGIKYLEIELNQDVEEIMISNMESLLFKIKVNLDNLSSLRLTLCGKVNIIKMFIALQINYLTGMIPICIPQQLLIRFINMIKNLL